MVLVGRDGRELRLGEDERLELLPRGGGRVLRAPDDVEARLVAVHRVEYHVAVVVQLVVRQLQLVERHHLQCSAMRIIILNTTLSQPLLVL